MRYLPPDYFRKLEKAEIFPDPSRPLEIDLGCGDGGFLVCMAAEYPERDWLGVERLLGRVRKVCRRAEREGVANLKVLRLETTYTIEWLLPDECAARVHLLFPDPWPKKKHHKRRMVTPEFCSHVRRVLEPGGEFCFKTDHPDYFEGSMESLAAAPFFEQVEWRGDEFFYAQTDFERQWLAEGKTIQSARFKRID